ncbi:hypothetical protein ACROYT_G017507 [Oculina patagonica]
MKEYFEQFDEIVEAVIIRERNSQRSKGYGFVTMATKEGAERACVNKRPIIDGRRANVDLAYLGAKPKVQRDNAASPECSNAPASPPTKQANVDLAYLETEPKIQQDDDDASNPDCPSPENSEADAATDTCTTEWSTEKDCPNFSTTQSFHGNFKYDSSHPAPPMVLPPAPFNMQKQTRVSGIQTVSSNLPLMNTMTYYQGNIPPYSAPPGNPATVDPNFLDQTGVSLVTFVPQGPVATPLQNTSVNVQCLPQFGQVPPQPAATELMPSPRYIYTVPVWYVDQGRVSCGQVSLEPVSRYSQAPLISAGVDGNTNGGFPACKMYPIPSYY